MRWLATLLVQCSNIWQPFGVGSTRVAQKVMPHIFFSETIYSECMKFTHSINGCFLYTSYFSTWSPSKSTALRQRKTRACIPSLYQLVSCSRSHVITARITLSSSSNLVPRSASFSGPKRWKSDGAMYVARLYRLSLRKTQDVHRLVYYQYVVYKANRMCSVKIIRMVFYKELTENLKVLLLFLVLAQSISQLCVLCCEP
jgi:hypothetical protein